MSCTADTAKMKIPTRAERAANPARYASIMPANSRWLDGWLLSVTCSEGFYMVRYPSERPFVMSRDEWHALCEWNPLYDEN